MAQSDKFKRVKPDITPYLFHFTKGENAKETLETIFMKSDYVQALMISFALQRLL